MALADHGVFLLYRKIFYTHLTVLVKINWNDIQETKTKAIIEYRTKQKIKLINR